MQTTLLASIGASSRTSATGQARPVEFGVPNGCSAISRAVIVPGSPDSPSMLTKATPSGLAIRPRRIYLSLVAVASAAPPGAAGPPPPNPPRWAQPGAAGRHRRVEIPHADDPGVQWLRIPG